ncbi:unnamed protein product [Mytilus edulis]|uniref:DUF6589 domain-containing protein n=1 Tax=Mytilus edulis TaxID=6550 RepID=A0A8S3UP33_MYTED|nr:unnamed protein product [Mytilus edulis]
MDDSETCINCNNKFEKRNKGYKRTSIDSQNKLPAISLRSVLNNTIDTQVTPDKSLYVCNTCASSVVKIFKSQSTTKDALDEFNKLQADTSYIRKRKRPLFQSTLSKQTFEFVSPQSTADKSLLSPVSKKRCNIFSPKKVVVSPKKTGAHSSKGFMDKAVQALRSSHYFSAFKCLYEKSKSARQGFTKLIQYAVRQEIKRLDLGVINLSKPLNEGTLDEFSWKPFIDASDKCIPTLTSAIKAALTPTPRKEIKVAIDEKNHVGPLLPAYGTLLANMLHVRFPTRVNFMQNIVSIEMYRSGCNHKIFRWFNRLGLCRSVTTTQRVIDDLCANYDSKIKNWKNNVQIDAGNLRAVRVPVRDDNSSGGSSEGSSISSDVTIGYAESSPNDTIDEDSHGNDDLESDTDGSHLHDDLDGIVPLLESSVIDDQHDPVDHNLGIVIVFKHLQTFSLKDDGHKSLDFPLCWDNVQKLSIARHKGDGTDNKMMLWALSFATRNRIGFLNLDDFEETVPAKDIPLHNFLPMDSDWERLQTRMGILIQRILKKHCAAFEGADVCMHIPHRYSKESSKKIRDCQPWCLKRKPPASCRGVIEIMKYLKQYIPLDPNAMPIPIICNGDQLSVERMVTGRLAMAVSEEAEDQLVGLIPRPQGFHKRCILLQDCMNKFFDGKSAGSRGSLFQIRNRFKYKNVKKKTSDCINDTQDFWTFVTEGLVCVLCCKLLNVTSLEEINPDGDINDLLKQTSEQIVNMIWPDINKESFNTVVEDLDKTIPYNDDIDELDDTLNYEEIFSDDEDIENSKRFSNYIFSFVVIR